MRPGILIFPLWLAVLTAAAGTASAQTTNAPPAAPAFQPPPNPPYTPPPAAPKPHVVDVPQPNQPEETPAPEAEANPDHLSAAKITEYQGRFQDGYLMQQNGQYEAARSIYDGILAEEPNARRSLLEAGRISLELGELAKADDYLERLHRLVPNFPEAIELLIQINQGLKRDVKVELLLREFRTLHDSGKIPEFTKSPSFVRERIPFQKGTIMVTQFFDYTAVPNTVWMGEVYDGGGFLKQRLLLNYDTDATRALRAKDPKFQSAQVFTWVGHEVTSGRVTKVNAYLQIFALPDYQKFRSAMLLILAQPPKPLYSAPVPDSATVPSK